MELDHVVLWVENPNDSLDFYVDVLGLTPVRAQEHAAGEAPFPSVRVNDTTILDLMSKHRAAPVSGVAGGAAGGQPINHVCLDMKHTEYDELVARLEAHGVELTPVRQGSFGARGPAERSQYFCDPDGNVIEIRHYDSAS